MSNSNEPSQFKWVYAIWLYAFDHQHANHALHSLHYSGNLKSVSGQVQEQIGNLTGSKEWQQSGKQQHAEGEAELKAAQAKGYAEGLVDQVGGYKDSIVGAVTGNKTDQIAGNARQEAGKAQKDANAPA